jgi:hypothetical protein
MIANRNASGSRDAGSAGARTGGAFDSNRPPSAQRNFANEGGRNGYGAARGTQTARAYANDAIRPGGRATTAGFTPQSRRGGPEAGRGISRVGSSSEFQSDRPPSARTAPTNHEVGRVQTASYAAGVRGGSNVGGSHFAGSEMQGQRSLSNSHFMSSNASMGGFGGTRFSNSGSFGQSGVSQRGSMFSGNGFHHYGSGYGHYGHAGFGYGGYRHYGYGRYGYGHYGYGWGGGWGWGSGGDGLWLLDDLFGLALNFSSLALNPWSPVATLGADLIDSGAQALGNLDNNNDQGSYNNYQQQYPDHRQPYPPLCGSDYSDENPGCVQ